jgi:hypothetical protein
MGVQLLTERHKDKIAGVLCCYDRIIIQGTVPGWCYASGMTDFYNHQIRIFDYRKWVEQPGLKAPAVATHGSSRPFEKGTRSTVARPEDGVRVGEH